MHTIDIGKGIFSNIYVYTLFLVYTENVRGTYIHIHSFTYTYNVRRTLYDVQRIHIYTQTYSYTRIYVYIRQHIYIIYICVHTCVYNAYTVIILRIIILSNWVTQIKSYLPRHSILIPTLP